jgi:hypothetical protein
VTVRPDLAILPDTQREGHKMRTVYVVELSAAERKHLQQVVAAGQGAAHTLAHATSC